MTSLLSKCMGQNIKEENNSPLKVEQESQQKIPLEEKDDLIKNSSNKKANKEKSFIKRASKTPNKEEDSVKPKKKNYKIIQNDNIHVNLLEKNIVSSYEVNGMMVYYINCEIDGFLNKFNKFTKELKMKFNLIKIESINNQDVFKHEIIVNVMENNLKNSSVSIIYNTDLSVLNLKTMSFSGQHNIVFIFNFSNGIVIKEIEGDSLRLCEIHKDRVDFESIINDDSVDLDDYKCTDINSLLSLLESKELNVVIVDINK
jgi:hypothetical protein